MEFLWRKIVLAVKYNNKLMLLNYYMKLRVVICVGFRRNCFQLMILF